MPIHIVKLCVGVETVDDLKRSVKRKSSLNKNAGLGAIHEHVTRMRPRREEELMDGGSLYWVIKGMILARQEVLRLDARKGDDEIERCAIVMRPKVVLTEPMPRRAFQGWRYLQPADAPKDLRGEGRPAMAAALRMELAELGLL
ncbi:MAG: DUF1489 domain-containing protein [Pseudomonadota bacterium]